MSPHRVDAGHVTWKMARMRAITYARLGDPSVPELVERPIPEPGDGEVRIRVLVSGVSPTDWKSRSGAFGGELTETSERC
jgi:NADPH2:quinone reductase